MWVELSPRTLRTSSVSPAYRFNLCCSLANPVGVLSARQALQCVGFQCLIHSSSRCHSHLSHASSEVAYQGVPQ